MRLRTFAACAAALVISGTAAAVSPNDLKPLTAELRTMVATNRAQSGPGQNTAFMSSYRWTRPNGHEVSVILLQGRIAAVTVKRRAEDAHWIVNRQFGDFPYRHVKKAVRVEGFDLVTRGEKETEHRRQNPVGPIVWPTR
jgi:hypothetical protein